MKMRRAMGRHVEWFDDWRGRRMTGMVVGYAHQVILIESDESHRHILGRPSHLVQDCTVTLPLERRRECEKWRQEREGGA